MQISFTSLSTPVCSWVSISKMTGTPFGLIRS
jgi:hypothetical protein